MISVEELGKAVYEDLNGQIVDVSIRDDRFHLLFECDDWEGTHAIRLLLMPGSIGRQHFSDRTRPRRRRFDLCFEHVAESTATPSSTGAIHVTDEHPLLWNHNDEHVSMFFSSSPANPFELLGELCDAHAQLFKGWRQLSDYLHASHRLMQVAYGLFAKGPRRVVEEYQRIVEGKLRYSVVHGYQPQGGYRAVLFDTCYVICRCGSATEIPADVA